MELELAWGGQDIFRACGWSVLQASLSSLGTMLSAFLLLPFYLSLKRTGSWARPLLLLPQLCSPVLVVLGLLLTWPGFPQGLIGICFAHILVNIGFAVVLLGQAAREIQIQWYGLNLFFRGSLQFYLRRVFLPLIIPHALKIFGLIFIFCLASLYIPLALSTSNATQTLEVLLYEKIRSTGQLKEAILVGGVQFLLQGLVLLALHKVLRPIPFRKNSQAIAISPEQIGYKSGVFIDFAWPIVFWIILFLISMPFIEILITAAKHKAQWAELVSYSEFWTSISYSIFVATTVGALFYLIILLWNVNGSWGAILFLPQWSGLLVGLAGLKAISLPFVHQNFIFTPLGLFLTLVICHLIFLLPAVIRVSAQPLIEMHQKYFPQFQIWGGSKLFLVKKVYMPLNKKHYGLAALLAITWSLGDFSVAAIVSPGPQTLPLYVQSLMGQYRLEMAAAAALILLLAGVVFSLAWEVLSNGKN